MTLINTQCKMIETAYVGKRGREVGVLIKDLRKVEYKAFAGCYGDVDSLPR
jgi:hypothetical protein